MGNATHCISVSQAGSNPARAGNYLREVCSEDKRRARNPVDNDIKDQKLENLKRKIKKNGDELEVLKKKTEEKLKEFRGLWKEYLDLLNSKEKGRKTMKKECDNCIHFNKEYFERHSELPCTNKEINDKFRKHDFWRFYYWAKGMAFLAVRGFMP